MGEAASARSALHWANVRHEDSTVFASGSGARTFDDQAGDDQAGDAGYVLFAMGHHVKGASSKDASGTPVRFLQAFASDRDRDDDVSLARWMVLTPLELAAANLNVAPALLDAPPTAKQPAASA